MVAGTGLGSFYEYFAGKEDLARVCLHLRSKALLNAMQEAIARHAGHPLSELVDAIIDSQLDAHRERPLEWGAHYLLERHLSGPDAYRKMYERFVDEWAHALAAAADPLPGARRREAARVCLTVIYGLMAQAHIGAANAPDATALSRQMRSAIHGYLREALQQGDPDGP